MKPHPSKTDLRNILAAVLYTVNSLVAPESSSVLAFIFSHTTVVHWPKDELTIFLQYLLLLSAVHKRDIFSGSGKRNSEYYPN